MLIYYWEICSTPIDKDRGNKLHIKKETKAISTLLAILLILVSAIIGALLAYMWTVAPFIVESGDTVDLIVTSVNFPADHATSFGVTVMNPSHSIADTNITDIYIESLGTNRTSIQSSDPSLPILLQRGTTQTFNCSLDWGGLAGRIITVHVLSINNTEAARSILTPSVRLDANTNFDASESINYFNLTVTNANSPINLTLSRVLLDYNPVANLSITLPKTIQPNDTIPIICYANWQGHIKPIVQVETLEGFTAEVRKEAPSTVNLQVSQVNFNETNTNQVTLTLTNSADSATYVNITSIDFTHGNTTDTISGNLSNPTLPLTINTGETVTLICLWNWTDASYRDIDVTMTAYTKQGFASPPLTVRTPARNAGRIDEVHFDLDDTTLFSVNITNFAYSLQTANVTRIDINQNPTSINTALITPGAHATFTCAYNWSSLVGANVTIRAHVMYDSNETQLTYTLKLPYLKITNASFSSLSPETPYVNITVRNSEFSKVKATITSLLIKNETSPLLVVGSTGFEVAVGSEVSIVYPWNWNPYAAKDVTIIVTTVDGSQASATFKVQ
jgi:hypothetical protein